jgi:hypothetical protein
MINQFNTVEIVSYPRDFPEIYDYSDILVVPYTSLFDWSHEEKYHIGGPIWPDWERITGPRFQYNNDEHYGPVDVCPTATEPELMAEGDHFFWIGPIYNHFGHQIRDFSTRILPSLIANPQAVLVYATFDSEEDRLSSTPAFFRGILDWFGVSSERVRIVNRPTLFRRLRVATQPEQGGLADFADPPHPSYISALTRHSHAKLGRVRKRGVTFVSRSQSRRLLLGEAEIDSWFERSGHRVFHPELHSLHKQLSVYASAATLIFSEGSAIHGVQLLGQNLGHVIVIKRRPERHLGYALLKPRADQVSYVDCLKGLIATSDEADRVHGMAVVDVSALANQLHMAGVHLTPGAMIRKFRAAQRSDLRSWLSSWGASMLRSKRNSYVQIARELVRLRPPGVVPAIVFISGWRLLDLSRWVKRKIMKTLPGF